MRGSFAVRGQRLQRDLHAGADHATEVLAGARDDVEVGRGVEVHGHAGALHPCVRRDRVDQPVGPSSCGLSTRIGILVFTWGPTIIPRSPRCRSQKRSYSGPSCGTTVETIAPSRLSKESPPARAALRRGSRSGPMGVAVGRQPPVVGQLVAVEGAEVSLGVADIHREQHGAIIGQRRGPRRSPAPIHSLRGWRRPLST